MAIIIAWDALGSGLNMAGSGSTFVQSSGLTASSDASVSQYDSDTYLIAQWFENDEINIGMFISQYSGNIWKIETILSVDSDDNFLIEAYNINIYFNITGDYSFGTIYSDLNPDNDTIYGNNYADTIKSGTGNDKIYGNSGNDKLYGENGGDTLLGGVGNDLLSGGKGIDILTGGNGSDIFIFNTKLEAANRDKITDFNTISDTIWLDNTGNFSALTKLGVLSSKAFHQGTAAGDATDRIIYNKSTGSVSYDADGTGSTQAVHFATLSKGLVVTNTDFFVI